jgi:hypothetical protein
LQNGVLLFFQLSRNKRRRRLMHWRFFFYQSTDGKIVFKSKEEKMPIQGKN